MSIELPRMTNVTFLLGSSRNLHTLVVENQMEIKKVGPGCAEHKRMHLASKPQL